MPDLDLPPIARDFLAAHSWHRSGSTADAPTLAGLLAERGYPSPEPVLAFEASYGGLRLVESDPDAPSLVVGAFACLSSAPHYRSREGLVPVIFASDDVVYSLDADGRGWACAAMVEGVSRPTARDGRQLLTQAILWRALAAHPRSFDHKSGRQGEAIARELGLALIDDASSEHEKWWGDLDRLVVEIERGNGFAGPMTYVAPASPPPHPPERALYHMAVIVDASRLHTLQALVADALATDDDSALHDFERSQRRARVRRADAELARLDPQALLTALAQIASVASSSIAESTPGVRLLEAARKTPTHARDVAKNALEKLTARAARLEKLVVLGAPPPILENEAGPVLTALEALDQFDFTTRGSPGEESDPEGQTVSPRPHLVRECLHAIAVDGAQPMSLWEARRARCYVEGPAVFSRPTALESLAAYEALVGSFHPGGQPRLAEGPELASTLRRVRDARGGSDAGAGEPGGNAQEAFARYAEGQAFAIEHEHAVVEWITRSD